MKRIKLGHYIMSDSFMHSLDPRTKLVGCLVITFSTLASGEWYIALLNLLTMAVAFTLAGVGLGRVARGLRKLALILLLTFIFQSILTKGTPVASFAGITITREGLLMGVTTVLRLLVLYSCSTLLTMTTSPIKLAAGLESLLSPLSRLGVPIHQFAMVISTSLRFIPTIISEAEMLTQAQRSRGAPFNSPNAVVRVKSFLAVLIPLLAASLQRANELAMAMEARCYTGGPNKTRVSGLCLSRVDAQAMSVLMLVIAFQILINR